MFLTAPAMAQTVCGKRADIVSGLETGYAETLVSSGISSNGTLVEVFASKSGGWTIIFTRPGGLTCLVAVGEYWRAVENPFATETTAP